MVILRCTQKLLRRLPGAWPPVPSTEGSTTLLGDWYATVLPMRPQHLVLMLSERSRLCVLVPAREPARLAERWRATTGELLAALGVPHESVARELEAMADTAVAGISAAGVGRSMLGSINDFKRMLPLTLEYHDWDLPEVMLNFSTAPIGPLAYASPHVATRRLLG